LILKTAIEIAQEAKLKPIVEIAKSLGLSEDDIEQYGKYKAKVSLQVYKRLKDGPDGKIIIVTAITPTKAGEGKTTTAIGLSQALGSMGLKTIVSLREPSLGPVFGIKGGATGGGYSLVLPMEDIDLHFTGDKHAVATAHNLLSAMLDNHLAKGNALKMDINQIKWKRSMDMNERALRNMVIGLGGKDGGVPRQDGFEITSASEIMAILALSQSISELKERIGNITIAYSVEGKPVTPKDVNAVGAMALLLKDAVKPNLVQTLENTPAFVHAGPFANIAHGCPSLISIKTALKLTDYLCLEPGFGSDLGMEKFCDILCRLGGLKPDAAVLVVTVKALKIHGGAPDSKLVVEDVESVRKGLGNMERHLENIKNFGLPAVVAINRFPSDTEAEMEVIRKRCEELEVPVALSEVVAKGGKGGVELATKVLEALKKKVNFKYLYDLNDPIKMKIKKLAQNYGAGDVIFTKEAEADILQVEKLGFTNVPINMAKTPLSLTEDPKIAGAPKGFKITVTNVRPFTGAGWLVAYCGSIMTMPALPSQPAAEKMDIDDNGKITGLF
jgi:formate--tetrahydrofolate ligase